MCCCFIAYKSHADFELVLALNRDEFYERKTSPAEFWSDAPEILAGRDLEAGGTWLGLTTAGRIGILTNFRDPSRRRENPVSRGLVVGGWLGSNEGPEPFLQALARDAERYNGFNLIAGDGRGLHYFSSVKRLAMPIPPGIHGLSNAFLDTPWPKLERGKAAFAAILAESGDPVDKLLGLMRDDTRAPDAGLPSTGVGVELERILSPIFIASPTYGTRSTAIVLVGKNGRAQFIERTYSSREKWEERRYDYQTSTLPVPRW